ncbi:MAG: acyl-CoA dehydrogenase family protein [Rhodospirillaceae bacterium]
MYDLQLTPEQIEMRDTVRDFVNQEIKPAALLPARLEPFEKPLLSKLLGQAAEMGLRTLSLPEDAGGAGADCLTSCLVMEELGTGDPDIAVALAHTSYVGRLAYELASSEQRKLLTKEFVNNDQCHLALAAHDAESELGWCYHRPLVEGSGPQASAAKQSNGDWVIDSAAGMVTNAPIARFFIVQARTDAKKTGSNGVTTFLVPRDTAGMHIGEQPKATGASLRWQHGPVAPVTFKSCRVPASAVLGKEGQIAPCARAHARRATVELAAVNLGLGRVAYETAVDYAKIRRQGGRNIIEHQSIGSKLADCAIRLELARNLVWKAAWIEDHPDATVASGAELPLYTMARVYTAEAVHDVTLLAAECFGAMGVMRDMPLQKYVHDGMVFFHAEDSDEAAKLRIAEAIAGYERTAKIA